jgi:peptide/nickel transport system ATP-binding protein
MTAILEVKDLCLQLGKDPHLVLVSYVSFSLEKGKVLGIVGESGSGKSLTALSLLQLLPPEISISSGEIIFIEKGNNISLNTATGKELRRIRGGKISMIFQEPMSSLNPSMTCGKQVEEAITAHGGMRGKALRQKVISLMKEVNLPRPESLYLSYPHQLSGGQRQRLMIAMALSSDPEVLIADEPTTALDVTVQKNIIALLRELRNSRGLSVIFISHDLRLVHEIADDILVMRRGKTEEYAQAKELFENPVSPYTKGLIACQPPLTGKPFRLLTISDFESGIVRDMEKKMARPDIDRTTTPVIRIENLSISYHLPGGFLSSGQARVKAVKDVSFEVYKGETLGLVGESGCGKTTVGKAILKLIDTGEGNIYFRGEKISSLKGKRLKEFRSSVQVVFQDPFSSLNPKQTVFSAIDEVLKVHFPGLGRTGRRERTAELLLNVGLSESDMFKYPHQFSGGQRQRISIARSLATEPAFIVLDESVSALDVSVQAQVLNLLNDLKDRFDLSFLFISHDLSVVKYMSDRMIVMQDGMIEESGDPADIFEKPVSAYTQGLIAAIPGNQYSTSSTS